MITTYISGAMSGLAYDEVVRNFTEAASLIKDIGLEPVTPLSIYFQAQQWKKDNPFLTDQQIWKKAMLLCTEILLPCDSIYLMQNWVNSKGAKIERTISIETGKIILYESTVVAKQNILENIKEAICEVIGVGFEQYTKPSRLQELHFARLIFTYQAQKHGCLDIQGVANALHRSDSNARKYPYKYAREYAVNKEFREMANKVELFLKNKVSL